MRKGRDYSGEAAGAKADLREICRLLDERGTERFETSAIPFSAIAVSYQLLAVSHFG
jgi:hypothetical protein